MRPQWIIPVMLALFGWASLSWAQTCPPATPLGSGTTYQVPCGTPLASWPTNLSPGDNVLFQRGCTYQITGQYNIGGSGTSAARILIGAYGTGARPIISGANKAPDSGAYGISVENRNWITIDGLEVTRHYLGIRVTNSDRVTIRRSNVHTIRSAGIRASAGSDDFLAEYNEVSETGSNYAGTPSNGEGFYIATDPNNSPTEDVVLRPVLRYNTVVNDSHERIELKPGTRNAIVEGNLLDGGHAGIHSSHWPASTFQNNHQIRYNLIRNIQNTASSPYGMYIKTGALIHNNVVANIGSTGRPGITIHDNQNRSQTIIARRNTVYNASGAGLTDAGGTNTTIEPNNLVWASGSGNFGSNPLFVNPAAYDFRLQSGSPANGFGAYNIGDPLLGYGHLACTTTPEEPEPEPEVPQGTVIVADYNWENQLQDASVADNDCTGTGVTFGTPSPTQGAQYANFDADIDAITCPTKWHLPAQGTIRTLFNVSSCTHLAAGVPMYVYGASTAAFAERQQIKVFNNAGCRLTVGWGGSTAVLNQFATVTPGTWYYLAVTWASPNLQAYLTPLAGPVPTQTAATSYSGLTVKQPTAAWGNSGVTGTTQGFRGGLKDSRVSRRSLSLSEIQADYNFLTGGGTTGPATVTVSAWRVARADSPQDQHHWMAGLNEPGSIPSPGCVDVRMRVSVTDGDVANLQLLPVWRQNGTGAWAFLVDSDEGTLRLGENLQILNRTATSNLLGTTTFIAGSYQNTSPSQPALPVTLTDGQSTELVTTACPAPGLSLGTFFELCLAEPSGAIKSCPTPARLDIGGSVAWYKG